jgi:hypothetical protein
MQRKPDSKRRKSAVGPGQADASPAPHGETNVVEMPIQTDQRQHTHGANVAQSPSTPEGQLDPSVTVTEALNTGSDSRRSSKSGHGTKVHTMKKKSNRKTA